MLKEYTEGIYVMLLRLPQGVGSSWRGGAGHQPRSDRPGGRGSEGEAAGRTVATVRGRPGAVPSPRRGAARMWKLLDDGGGNP